MLKHREDVGETRTNALKKTVGDNSQWISQGKRHLARLTREDTAEGFNSSVINHRQRVSKKLPALMGQHPGIPVALFPSSERIPTEKSGRTYKTSERLRQRGEGERERVFHYKVYQKQSFSTATILSAGTVQVLYRALHRTYITATKIPLQQRKCDKGEMARILCAVWRNGKPCVFGIHVTALLKNASKPL